MKKLVFAVMILFAASAAGAQEVYRDGETVKGKDVTYKVRERYAMSVLLVRNMANPDTTLKPLPMHPETTEQQNDMMWQIAEIIHDCLTPEELKRIEEANKIESKEYVGLVLRIDREKHKLMQVTCFEFIQPLFLKEVEVSCEGFWLNLDPDRLHEIERAIVERVEVPGQIQKWYLTHDFEVLVFNEEILDVEKAREKRQKARERWKANPELYKNVAAEVDKMEL